MLSTKKTAIIKNFNQRASTYTAEAQMQAQIALEMANQLKTIEADSVLELGCGTGLLTQQLVRLYPDAELLITDVAPAMVEECRRLVGEHASVKFACMDGEQFELEKPLGLIVSSMTLHWFIDLQRSFVDITNQLQRGGQLVFSILGENSFKEWRGMCQQFNLPVGVPIFPAEHLLQSMLPNLELTVETYQQTYSSAYAFLKSLKTIGAITPRLFYLPVSAGKLRQVLRENDHEITISYEVIYGKYTRK
jgi:malonyl-CoA O-methyltransferase